MRDVKWLTHNCTVGYFVAGMWNNRYYSTSNTKITSCNRSGNQQILSSGDAEGHIRVFKYERQLVALYSSNLLVK